MNSKKTKRIVVAMSGGVDSSVAAALLSKKGYEVIGITMRLFAYPDEKVSKLNKSCCSLEDVEDARSVCRNIGAIHYFLNFEKEFNEHVVNYFISEYEKGRTPYPCLACNDRLKFDFLLKRAEFMNADYIATGHYAQIKNENNEWHLIKGKDETKDQSYVLYNLNQEVLSKLKLPIGKFLKSEIREIANDLGLINASKPDSQDICFIPDGNYKKFLEKRIEKNPGKIVDSSGNTIGKHDGVYNFTIGQRKGLNLDKGFSEPIFVTSIDHETKTVEVGTSKDLLKTKVIASSVNFLSGKTPKKPIKVTAKIRYHSKNSTAIVKKLKTHTEITFDEPQRAITPGQAIVFYKGDEVIGGGIIEGNKIKEKIPA